MQCDTIIHACPGQTFGGISLVSKRAPAQHDGLFLVLCEGRRSTGATPREPRRREIRTAYRHKHPLKNCCWNISCSLFRGRHCRKRRDQKHLVHASTGKRSPSFHFPTPPPPPSPSCSTRSLCLVPATQPQPQPQTYVRCAASTAYQWQQYLVPPTFARDGMSLYTKCVSTSTAVPATAPPSSPDGVSGNEYSAREGSPFLSIVLAGGDDPVDESSSSPPPPATTDSNRRMRVSKFCTARSTSASRRRALRQNASQRKRQGGRDGGEAGGGGVQSHGV